MTTKVTAKIFLSITLLLFFGIFKISIDTYNLNPKIGGDFKFKEMKLYE